MAVSRGAAGGPGRDGNHRAVLVLGRQRKGGVRRPTEQDAKKALKESKEAALISGAGRRSQGGVGQGQS